jgi:glycosyltransferase involved in cell wall biosynthesis
MAERLTGASDSSPLVSIIMNCYNGEKYLADAIESVFAQTYENWELVFWDNQSVDSSATILHGYKDPRLKYFYAPKHTLLYEARNYAVEKAGGELFAFLDVDDWWAPDKLSKQIPLFDDPAVGIVCSNYWIVDERKGRKRRFLDAPPPTGRVFEQLLRSYFVGLVTLMVRRSALDSLEYPFDPRYHVIGDSDLVIRLSMRWKLEFVDQPIAYCRLHGRNETLHNRDRELKELECWTGELTQKPEISQSARDDARSHLRYFKGMLAATRGDARQALTMWRALPLGKYKLRLLIAMLLPIGILRRLKQ